MVGDHYFHLKRLKLLSTMFKGEKRQYFHELRVFASKRSRDTRICMVIRKLIGRELSGFENSKFCTSKPEIRGLKIEF